MARVKLTGDGGWGPMAEWQPEVKGCVVGEGGLRITQYDITLHAVLHDITVMNMALYTFYFFIFNINRKMNR